MDSQVNDSEVWFRVKVFIRHELKNGLRAGDEFTPVAETRNRDDLSYCHDWWNEQGHTAIIQSRFVHKSYGNWTVTA